MEFDLQTSLLRALPTFVPVLLFPAMNTHMFSHPLTSKQLDMVRDELKYTVHGPIAKTLACGDIGTSCISKLKFCSKYLTPAFDSGVGAMTEWREIVDIVVQKYDLVLL